MSHIVFEAGGNLAGRHGGIHLYEYVGVGNAAPTLMDVSGGPGSTDMIGVCGSRLGGESGRASAYNPLSADGRTVFFTVARCSSGSGVNAGVEVPTDTLYARIDGSRTVLISGRSPHDCTGSCLTSQPEIAEYQGASVDGSKVFFTSKQRLTDDASEGEENLYEYDFSRPTGENLSAISAGDTSGTGPGVHGIEAISQDGSHVYFASTGVLTGAANSQGQTAQAGAENLYVFERDVTNPTGRLAFIAVLAPADEAFYIRSEISYPSFSTAAEPSTVGTANVTPDGRFLVFLSHGQLTADDHYSAAFAQVFRYDAQTGQLVRISVGEHGIDDNGNNGAGDASIVASSFGWDTGSDVRTDPTMSHDGSFIFFESPLALTAHALNDVRVGDLGGGHLTYAENVYEWHQGQVYLISDGQDTTAIAPPGGFHTASEAISAVELLGSDATGANVFFATSDRLTAQDTDTGRDYYDARVCSASSPCIVPPGAPGAACAGDACRDASGATPSLAGAASASFVGAGNQVPSVTHAAKAKKKAKPRKGRRARRHRKSKRGSAKRSSRSTLRSR
jgi:hypothetical protein